MTPSLLLFLMMLIRDEKYFKSLTCDKAVLVDVKGMYRDKIHELKYWSL